MLTFIGFVAVAFFLLYKRSTEIITVNPLRGQGQTFLPAEKAPDEENEQEVPDFARLLNTITRTAAQASGANLPAAGAGRDEILALVRRNRFIEAIQLYRRIYGTDLAAAKKAVDKMMLEQ